ncbi:MAG TPA: PLP-dependent aminotransferase family protein [Microvirga sp.]|nr:PLP-dependent aminotransferase family protein [Microvirga sp.]
MLDIDRASSTPIFRQIYMGIRQAVTEGSLAPGSQLPATRDLAQRLNVSRTSVLSAFNQLRAEGYIDGRLGAGTFISSDLDGLIRPEPSHAGSERSLAGPRSLSGLGQRYREVGDRLPELAHAPFHTGWVSPDAQTMDVWRRISSRQLASHHENNFGYSDSKGLLSLRTQIVHYLRAARLVKCDVDRVVITSGTQQGFDLALRVLINPGDCVWMEDPGYPAVRDAVRALGAQVVAVPVDGSGLNVASALARAPSARVACVTPSHQFPTGTVLSMARRLELLEWAKQSGAWIIEDDYDSEFRYSGQPLASLQGLDVGERVIYIGTFSKVLFPGLRLGFVVLPPDLVTAFQGARHLVDRHPPTLQQMVLSDFMSGGFLTGHIRRTRQRYKAARDVVVEELRARVGGQCEIPLPDCGMQLVCYLPEDMSDIAVTEAAAERGVYVRPLSTMYESAPSRPGLVLGFTGHDHRRLRTAASQLAAIIHAQRDSRSQARVTVPSTEGPRTIAL